MNCVARKYKIWDVKPGDKVLVGKLEGKRPLGRPRRRWEDNINMDLQEVGCGVWTGWSWLRIGKVGGRL